MHEMISHHNYLAPQTQVSAFLDDLMLASSQAATHEDYDVQNMFDD